MVLIWIGVVNFVFWSFMIDYYSSLYVSNSTGSKMFLQNFWWVCLVPTPVVAGWLADAKFGMYKVVRVGMLLILLCSVLNCAMMLVREKLHEMFNTVCFSVISCSFYIGYSAFITGSTQLGLDQMPDASSENICSFIAWAVFSTLAGIWTSGLFGGVWKECINPELRSTYDQIWSLAQVLCMTVVLVFDFLLTPKLLIIEPKSPQSLKVIYQVLMFAAKHKAPLNRSALTYWENDIPSRLDLGKSRYGGPFSTEQVEDVKTALRIVVVSITFWIGYTFITLPPVGFDVTGHIANLLDCESMLISLFSYNNVPIALIGLVLQELVIFPITQGKLSSSSLKRIEAVYFLKTLLYVVCLILTILQYCNIGASVWIARLLFSVSSGLVYQVSVTSMLEFVCAQSPYNMRGLFVGAVYSQYAISTLASILLSLFSNWCNSHESCPVLYWSTACVLVLLCFLLFCVVARWYKRRVRDDGFYPQVVVEEVYDRYLTAAAAQHRAYGMLDD